MPYLSLWVLFRRRGHDIGASLFSLSRISPTRYTRAPEDAVEPLQVAAFYKFTSIADAEVTREWVRALGESWGIRGTVLVAPEGINGTIAGSASDLPEFWRLLCAREELGEIEVKYSTAQRWPFRKLKVRLKEEIVRMKIPGVDPNRSVGNYVEPTEWNDLIAAEDVIVVDTRNHFECAMGTFQGAIDPNTVSFGEFPAFIQENLDEHKGKRIAMFCTGGIRCEKATSYMVEQGFEQVFHLKGGILKYLEEVPAEESLWEGSCFVFDERVGIGHGLVEEGYVCCHVCRWPCSPEVQASEDFLEDYYCPNCRGKRTPEQEARALARARQKELAREREAKGA